MVYTLMMTTMMHSNTLYFLLAAAALSFAFTMVVMPLLLQFCRLHQLYDQPGGRKVHSQAIPRLGGILFMPAMLLGLALFIILSQEERTMVIKTSSVLLAVGAFLIYIIGTTDDLLGMKATHKFAIQFVAALIMPLFDLYINNFYGIFGLYELPLWFCYPFTVFIILLIVNAVNLIDGIDGLASGLAILILGIYVVLFVHMECTRLYAAGAAALLGSLLSFFCFNMFGSNEKNTKTFMGDSGSLFLGYALAYLSIKYAMNNTAVLPYRPYALLLSYTLLIVPTFDVIRVALGRVLRRKPMFAPDKTHIHHKVMDAGFTMHQTWYIIMALFALFCALNYALYQCEVPATAIVLTDVLLYLLFLALLRFKKSLSAGL